MATDQNVPIFLEVLRQILPSLSNQNDERLTKRIGKDKLQECADDVAGYIESGTSGSLTKNERLALTNQVLKCLVNHIKNEMKIPVTLNTIISSTQLIEHATDCAYPGYASSKLLRYTISPLKSQDFGERKPLLPTRN